MNLYQPLFNVDINYFLCILYRW